jgi:hypothetical protein
MPLSPVPVPHYFFPFAASAAFFSSAAFCFCRMISACLQTLEYKEGDQYASFSLAELPLLLPACCAFFCAFSRSRSLWSPPSTISTPDIRDLRVILGGRTQLNSKHTRDDRVRAARKAWMGCIYRQLTVLLLANSDSRFFVTVPNPH